MAFRRARSCKPSVFQTAPFNFHMEFVARFVLLQQGIELPLRRQDFLIILSRTRWLCLPSLSMGFAECKSGTFQDGGTRGRRIRPHRHRSERPRCDLFKRHLEFHSSYGKRGWDGASIRISLAIPTLAERRTLSGEPTPCPSPIPPGFLCSPAFSGQ